MTEYLAADNGSGYDPEFARLSEIITRTGNGGYAWAATYSAGSDCMIYRRYAGSLPPYASSFAVEPPAHVVAFCEANNVDVCADDELVPGRVRKVKLFSDEAP